MKVSWDDDIPNIWKVIKVMFQTTNQFVFLGIHVRDFLSYVSVASLTVIP